MVGPTRQLRALGIAALLAAAPAGRVLAASAPLLDPAAAARLEQYRQDLGKLPEPTRGSGVQAELRAHTVGLTQFAMALGVFMFARLSAEVAAGRIDEEQMQAGLIEMMASPKIVYGYLQFIGAYALLDRVMKTGGFLQAGIFSAELAAEGASGLTKAAVLSRLYMLRHGALIVTFAAMDIGHHVAECLARCPWEPGAHLMQGAGKGGCPSGQGLVGSLLENVWKRPGHTFGAVLSAAGRGVAQVDALELMIMTGGFLAGSALASVIPGLGQSGFANILAGMVVSEALVSVYKAVKTSEAVSRRRDAGTALIQVVGALLAGQTPSTELLADAQDLARRHECDAPDRHLDALTAVQRAFDKASLDERKALAKEYRTQATAVDDLTRGRVSNRYSRLVRGTLLSTETLGMIGTSGEWSRLNQSVDVAVRELRDVSTRYREALLEQRAALLGALPMLGVVATHEDLPRYQALVRQPRSEELHLVTRGLHDAALARQREVVAAAGLTGPRARGFPRLTRWGTTSLLQIEAELQLLAAGEELTPEVTRRSRQAVAGIALREKGRLDQALAANSLQLERLRQFDSTRQLFSGGAMSPRAREMVHGALEAGGLPRRRPLDPLVALENLEKVQTYVHHAASMPARDRALAADMVVRKYRGEEVLNIMERCGLCFQRPSFQRARRGRDLARETAQLRKFLEENVWGPGGQLDRRRVEELARERADLERTLGGLREELGSDFPTAPAVVDVVYDVDSSRRTIAGLEKTRKEGTLAARAAAAELLAARKAAIAELVQVFGKVRLTTSGGPFGGGGAATISGAERSRLLPYLPLANALLEGEPALPEETAARVRAAIGDWAIPPPENYYRRGGRSQGWKNRTPYQVAADLWAPIAKAVEAIEALPDPAALDRQATATRQASRLGPHDVDLFAPTSAIPRLP